MSSFNTWLSSIFGGPDQLAQTAVALSGPFIVLQPPASTPAPTLVPTPAAQTGLTPGRARIAAFLPNVLRETGNLPVLAESLDYSAAALVRMWQTGSPPPTQAESVAHASILPTNAPSPSRHTATDTATSLALGTG